MNLKPAGPLLRDVAQYLGYGVVEIRARPEAVGIIAKATTLVANEGISIRQILAEDAEIYPDPKLVLITEKPIPGELVSKFLEIQTVMKVSIS
jgi:predicted regulator of amino acid metabolism with ACT domain